MKKAFLLFLLLVLAACGAKSTTETAVIEPADNESSDLFAANNDNETPVTAVPISTDFTPAITPVEASQIREQDHVLGATEPAVTIIEYGDFQ